MASNVAGPINLNWVIAASDTEPSPDQELAHLKLKLNELKSAVALAALKSKVKGRIDDGQALVEALDALDGYFADMAQSGLTDTLSDADLGLIKTCLKQEMVEKTEITRKIGPFDETLERLRACVKPGLPPPEVNGSALNKVLEDAFKKGFADGLARAKKEKDEAASQVAQAADQEAELAANARLQAALVNVKQLLVQAGELNQQLMSLGIDLAEARQQAVAAQIEEEFLDLTEVAPTASPVIEPAVAVAEVLDVDDLEPEPAGKPTRPARAKASGK